MSNTNKNPSNIKIGKVTGNVTISQNQSGGSTSHTTHSNTIEPKSFLRRNFWNLISAVGVLIAVLTYFGIRYNSNESSKLIAKTASTTQKPLRIEPDTISAKTSIGAIPKSKPKRKIMYQNKKTDAVTPLKVGNVTGDVVISQNQSGGITAHTVNITSAKFIQLTDDKKLSVNNNLTSLLKKYKSPPTISITIEAGNNMRNKVATEFEDILTPFNAVSYPKGNTIMGFAPDYPVTIIANINNKEYINAFIKAISPFLIADYHFEYLNDFPENFIKFYINGSPTFDESGTVTIE